MPLEPKLLGAPPPSTGSSLSSGEQCADFHVDGVHRLRVLINLSPGLTRVKHWVLQSIQKATLSQIDKLLRLVNELDQADGSHFQQRQLAQISLRSHKSFPREVQRQGSVGCVANRFCGLIQKLRGHGDHSTYSLNATFSLKQMLANDKSAREPNSKNAQKGLSPRCKDRPVEALTHDLNRDAHSQNTDMILTRVAA